MTNYAQLPLNAREIEEIAHRVCRYSDQNINFYVLQEQITSVLKERASLSSAQLEVEEDFQGNTDHVGRGLEGIPQPYAGAIVLLETIAQVGARAFIGMERTGNSELCTTFAEALRSEGHRAHTASIKPEVDLRKVYQAVSTLSVNSSVTREHQDGFQQGVAQASAVIAGFGVPELRQVHTSAKDVQAQGKDFVSSTMIAAGLLNHSAAEGQSTEESAQEVVDIYRAMRAVAPQESPKEKVEGTADTTTKSFGRFHTRHYPDGSAFTFQTHSDDPDSFELFAEPVGKVIGKEVDLNILFRAAIAVMSASKRLCSSEDVQDVPGRLVETSKELTQLRTTLRKYVEHADKVHILPADLTSLMRFDCVRTPDGKAEMYAADNGPYVWLEHVESLFFDDESLERYAQLTADARRYRFLRNGQWNNQTHPQIREHLMTHINRQALDTVIDAACTELDN